MTGETGPRAIRQGAPHRTSGSATPLGVLVCVLGVLAASCGDDGGSGQGDADCSDPLLCPDGGGDADVGPGDGGDQAEAPVCDGDDDCDAAQFCDPDSGECFDGCRLEPDNCEGDCQICDATDRVCRLDPVCANACESDEECGSNQFCDLANDPGQCRTGCRIDAPECPSADIGYCCNAGEICDSDSRLCRSEPCDRNSDCAVLQFCLIPEDDPDSAECRDGCRTSPDNCRGTWDADLTEVCDAELHQCVEIDCGSNDSLCPDDPDPTHVCEGGLCRPGCRGADDCSAGQPCDPDSRLCGCDGNADCDEVTVCVDNECIERCVDNADCAVGVPFCNDVSGRCFATCPNEASEPNNAPAAADDFGDTGFLSGVLCGVDRDWFRIDGNADESIELSIVFDPGLITVEVRGGDELDEVLLEPVSSTDHMQILRVRVDIAADGPVAVGFSGSGEPDDDDRLLLGFSAQVERFPTVSCRPDDFEDNDDFSQSGPPLMAGELVALSLCADDAGGDWYALSLLADELAAVTVSYEDPDDDLVLRALDDSLAEIEIDGGVGSPKFVAVGPFGDATDVYLHVDGLEPGVDEVRDYTLDLDLSAVAACAPDAFEGGGGDDTVETATPSGATIGADPVAFAGLTACFGDPDLFSINGLADGTIVVDIAQSSAARTLLVAILDSDGSTVLASDETVALDRTVQALGLPRTGTFYVHIEDIGGDDAFDGVGYELTLETLAPTCADSADEPNESPSAATPAIGGGAGLTFDSSGLATRLCQSDQDYYAVEMASDGTLSVSLTGLADLASFRLELLEVVAPDSTVLVEQAVPTGAQSLGIAERPLDSGSYVLRVYGMGFIPLLGRSYTLTAEATLEGEVCEDSPDEPGGTAGTALLLTTGTTGQLICPSDTDYYRVTLTGPTSLDVSYQFPELVDCDDTGVALELFRLDGSVGNSDIGIATCNGSLSLDYLDVGEARFRFFDLDVADAGVLYDVALDLAPIANCAPGANDEPASADPFAPGQRVGRVCSGGADWYLGALATDTRHTFALDGSAAPDVLVLELLPFGDPSTPVAMDTTAGDGIATIVRSDLAGLHYLRVRPDGAAPAAGLSYILNWATEAQPVCLADYLEPNDDQLTAAGVGGVMTQSLSLCQGDVDWLSFDLGPVPEDVTITVHQDDTSVPLTVRVHHLDTDVEPAVLELVRMVSDNNNPKVLAETLSGLNYVEISEEAGSPVPEAGVPIRVDVEIGALVCTDFLEPDSIEAQANPVPVDEVTIVRNLQACTGDVDLFAFEVTDGETDLVATIDRTAPTTSMTLRLLASGGGELDSVTGSGADTSFELTADDLAPGDYLVEVSAASPPPAGEAYDITLDVAAPFVCVDPLEVNNTPGTATLLSLPATRSARLCEADAASYDYYRVDPAEGPLRLTAQLINPTGGQMRVSLRDSADTELAFDSSAVSLGDLDAPGPYYVRVETGAPGLTGLPYDLVVTSALDGCTRDASEDNDSRSTTTAAPPGFEQVRVLCVTVPADEDDDWYRFTVDNTGDDINVRVQHDSTPHAVQVEIVNDSDVVLAAVENTTTFKDFWSFDNPAGTYYVHLSHEAPSPDEAPPNGLRYEVNVVVSSDNACVADVFEPNDEAGEAQAPRFPIDGGIACPSDEDWYLLTALSTLADVSTTVTHAGSDEMSVELYADGGATLLDSDTGTAALSVSADDQPQGGYLVRIRGLDPPMLGVVYQLATSVVDKGCLPDVFESNESIADAASLEIDGTPLFDLQAAICTAGDRDFYALNSQGAVAASVSVLPTCDPGDGGCTEPTPADVSLRLYDPAGNPLAFPFDLSHPPDVYVAEVFTTSSPGEIPTTGQPYAFNWTTDTACLDDAFETDGDSFGDPSDGDVMPVPAELVICGDDPDVVAYTTPAGGPSDVFLQALFDDADVSAQLSLYVEGDLVTPVDVDSGTNAPIFAVSARDVPASTTVYAVIEETPPSGFRRLYTLVPTIAPSCNDDAFEPNETLDEATPLAAESPTAAVACPNDIDLFETTSIPAGLFRVRVDTGGDPVTVTLAERVGETLVDIPSTAVIEATSQSIVGLLGATGDVVIAVAGAAVRVSYTIEVETTGVCFVDDVDDAGPPGNDDFADASALDPAQATAICPQDDVDWFSFVVNASQPGEGQVVDGFYVRAGLALSAGFSPELDLTLRSDEFTVEAAADESDVDAGGLIFTDAVYLTNGTYYLMLTSDAVPLLPFAYDLFVVESVNAP